jgi:hypothetical protein
MLESEQPQGIGSRETRATAGAGLDRSLSRPDAGASQIDNAQRSLGPAARGLDGGMRVPDKASAEAKTPELPAASPFYQAETATAAATRLRKILDAGKPPESFSKEVLGLRTKPETRAERAQMRYGLVVVGGANQRPKLVGWGLDDMICIASMAKLAILYAAFQLRADVEHILREGMTDPSPELARTATEIVARAFRNARDPALQAIGRAPATMPVLERIFDLDGFLASGGGTLRPLVFKKHGPGTGRVDDEPFYMRLTKVAQESANNAATSCIADIGLPYIKALLTRSGLADVSGQKKGLWLATTFGYHGQAWPGRKERLVSSGQEERTCERKGSLNEKGATGMGGTVRAIATFYHLLNRGLLVDRSSSVQMGELLDTTSSEFAWRYLVSGLQSNQTVLASSSKIGILGPWYHDSAMIISKALPRGGAGLIDTGFVEIQTPIRTWIAVVLLSNGATAIAKMAPDMERAVQNYMLSLAMRR